MVNRFDVYLVNLDAEPSKDAKNTRPAVVISPDEMNAHVNHVIIAPISASQSNYPTRILVELLKNKRSIIVDQIRTVEKDRLVKKIGEIDKNAQKQTLDCLQEMFGE